jgi:uncharacterized membrane-anchored protein
MKKIVFIVASVLALAAFNYSIFQNEQIKANGETVYLKLAPVDPRSLMQGDYMALRYAIEREQTPPEGKTSGYLIVSLDEKRVASFKGFYDGQTLQANERLLRYQAHQGRANIAPDSFMFQEGHADTYARAGYGVFKMGGAGRNLLVGLADENLNVIQPPLPAVK